jgi:hypothetical protein
MTVNLKLLTMLLLVVPTAACSIAKQSAAQDAPTGTKTAKASLAKGTAIGAYDQDGRKFSFTHAIALQTDNAENLRPEGPGLRVLLSDVEVSVDSIAAPVFPQVGSLAKAGKLHGLLLDFDPAKPDSIHITILDGNPGDASRSSSTSISQSGGVWSKIDVRNGQITATLKDRPGIKLSFTAPIVQDPIKQDLRGVSAQANSITGLLKDQANAIGRGDLAAIEAGMSKRRKPEVASAPPGMVAAMKSQAPMMLASVGQITRLIVRENTAIAIGPNGSFNSFVREEDGWKID